MLPAVRIRLFGGLEVEDREGERFGGRKARSALKRLAVARGAPVPVDSLADAVWGEDARPADQVSVLVSRLRGVLGADRIVRTDAGYSLVYDWLDLDAIEEIAAETERRFRSGEYAAARKLVTAGLSLQRGALLADEEADWADAERRSADRAVAKLRKIGAESSLALGEYDDAAELADAILDHDPYDEPALRVYMAATAGGGRVAAALNAYAAMQERLRDELGVDPSAETIAAHTAVLSGAEVPGVLIGARAEATETQGRAVDALPGRTAEIAELDLALQRAASATPQFVVIEGEAGIGKSRLLETWCARARSPDVTLLFGRTEEIGRALPLDVVFDALHTHLRRLDPEERIELLGPSRLVLEPLLGLGSGDADASSTAAGYGDPSIGQLRLFSALLEVFRRLADRAPTVLVLDDVHLASASTAEWLHFLMHRAGDARLLVVTARRPEEGPPYEGTSRISLGPLDVAATEAIVGSERASDLHSRSAGNPLFLIELAAAEATDPMPHSIQASVANRCERAGAAAPTLQAAAVIGSEVDVDLLATILRLPAIEILDHLEEGVKRHFLDDRGASFVFRHELVRDALAQATGASRRAFLHREAATALTARPTADPLDVAFHARLAGEVERASAALVQAARLAAARHEVVAAERIVDDAIALHPSAEAYLERARLRLAQTRPAEAADDATSAIAKGAGAAALEVAGWAAYYLRDFETAERLAENGRRLADDPTVRTSCAALIGRIRHASGDLAAADIALSEAFADARGAGLTTAAVWLGSLRVHQSRNDDGLALLERALSPSMTSTHRAMLHGHMNAAHAHGQSGRPLHALAELDRLDVEADRFGTAHLIQASMNFRAWVVRNLGVTSEADEHNHRALEAATRLRQPEPHMWSLLDLTDGLLRRRALDEADARLAQISDLYDAYAKAHDTTEIARAFRFRHELKSRYYRGRLALLTGRSDDALAIALDVADDAERLGVPRHVVMARLLEAQVRRSAGEDCDLDQVGVLLQRLHDIAGMESWLLTAETAASFGVDAWWNLAAERATQLASVAGPYAEGLLAHAQRCFDVLKDEVRAG